ncbi:MAG: RNA 2',3'-cyclic phosphodiesterase [Burkholderiaceae bacterium]
MSGSPPTLRVFIALWPSPETAAALMPWVHTAQAACGGRMMARDTLHLTLAFLGAVSLEQAHTLSRVVPAWRAPMGALTLSRFGCFAGPRVVWAGPSDHPDERPRWLDDLYASVWDRLRPLGWEPDHPVFRPHVSLLRRARHCDVSALSMPPLTWTPERCVLVASQPDRHASRYRVLAAMHGCTLAPG